MKNLSEVFWALRNMTEQIDWDSVYKSELPRIYNYFLYKIGDKEFAQDLTATTVERAWKFRFKYKKGIASLSTWFFGIARNVLKEHIRNYKMSKQRSEPLLRSEEMPSNVDVEKSIRQLQEKERLHKLLLDLPEREQELIALKYGAGLTNREIAKLTKLSESNVGSILHRTVKGLGNKLEENHGR